LFVKFRSRPFIAVSVVVIASVVACGRGGTDEEGQSAPMADSGITSLQKQDVTVGTGVEATKGKTVRVHYTGWLYDASAGDKRGEKFDSSKDRGEPFEFSLGAGEVIQGWDDGVAGMKVGGTRILTIPPALGYGARGAPGAIPPNATLVFEVQLLDVR
jgi:FKBP-type peptidyl-prolyl cis-trans isomerase FkpA